MLEISHTEKLSQYWCSLDMSRHQNIISNRFFKQKLKPKLFYLNLIPALGGAVHGLFALAPGVLRGYVLSVMTQGQLCRDHERAERVGLDSIVGGLRLEVGEHASEDDVPKLGNGVPSTLNSKSSKFLKKSLDVRWSIFT